VHRATTAGEVSLLWAQQEKRVGRQTRRMTKRCWPFSKQAYVTATAQFVPLAKIATVTDGSRHGSAPAVCPLIRSQLCMSMGRAGEAVMGRAGEALVISDAR